MTVLSITSAVGTETLTPDKLNKAGTMTDEARPGESKVKALVAKKMDSKENSTKPVQHFRGVPTSRPVNEMMSKFQSASRSTDDESVTDTKHKHNQRPDEGLKKEGNKVNLSKTLGSMMSKFEASSPVKESNGLPEYIDSTETKGPVQPTTKSDKEPRKDDGHNTHVSKSLNTMMSKFETTSHSHETKDSSHLIPITDKADAKHERESKKEEHHKHPPHPSASLNKMMSKFENVDSGAVTHSKSSSSSNESPHTDPSVNDETKKEARKASPSKSLNMMMSKFETKTQNESKDSIVSDAKETQTTVEASAATPNATPKVAAKDEQKAAKKAKDSHSTVGASKSFAQMMSSKFENASKTVGNTESTGDASQRSRQIITKSHDVDKEEKDEKRVKTVRDNRKKDGFSLAIASKFESKETKDAREDLTSPRRRERRRKRSTDEAGKTCETLSTNPMSVLKEVTPSKGTQSEQPSGSKTEKPTKPQQTEESLTASRTGEPCNKMADNVLETKSTTLLKSEAKLVLRLTPSPDRRETTPSRILVKRVAELSACSVKGSEKDFNLLLVSSNAESVRLQPSTHSEKLNESTPSKVNNGRSDDFRATKLSRIRTRDKDETKKGEETFLKARKGDGDVAARVDPTGISETIPDETTKPNPDSSLNTGLTHKTPPGSGEAKVKDQIAMWTITDKVRKQPMTSKKFDIKSDLAEGTVSEIDQPLKSRASLYEKTSNSATESANNKGCMDEVRKEIANELKNSRGGHEDSPLNSRLSQLEAVQDDSKGLQKGCIDDVRKEIAAELRKQKGNDEGELNLGSLVSNWQKRADEHQQKQMINPFSEWTGASHRAKLDKNDASYGRPLEGSLTEKRGREAEKYIMEETLKLCECIQRIGEVKEDGTVAITFGKLFKAYEVISDKVVGILLRARKYKYVSFEGEMLYQSRDDAVVITLFPDALPNQDS